MLIDIEDMWVEIVLNYVWVIPEDGRLDACQNGKESASTCASGLADGPQGPRSLVYR